MKLIALCLTVTSFQIFAGETLKDVFTQYVEIQSALSNDHFQHALMSVKKLHLAVGKVDHSSMTKEEMAAWMGQKDALDKATMEASKATDLDGIRAQFGTISSAMIALGETSGTYGFNQFHCPMALGGKGADWLQPGDFTKNPYFGAAMLHCGAMVKASKGDMGHSMKMDHPMNMNHKHQN